MKTSKIFQIQTVVTLFVTTLCVPLRTDVIPKEYNLEIIVNLGDEDDKFNFKGMVSIAIDCNEPTDTITMHAKNLNIDAEKVTLKSEDQENDGRAPAIVDTSLQPAEDFVVIKLLQSLKRGQRYVVELHFEGELEQNLVGFYRIYYYFGEEREQRWLALTHFKPYHARRVFPCFDEPIFMAKFLLSIGRSENYTSIGNMPLDRTEKMENKPGWEWDRYKIIESVPTWLVAFAVTDFSYVTVEILHDDNTSFPIRMWTRSDSLDHLDFARKIIPEFMKFYRKHLPMPATIPKKDIIAAPQLYSSGMSYPGFVMISEQNLLFDPKTSPIVYQETIAAVVAHEMAHHWFGNIVIAKWWSDLWLIEGIVKHLTEMALRDVYPNWHFARLQTTNDVMEVFYGDSMQSSTALLESFNQPTAMDQSMDTFARRKVSYIIRMVSHFLSPKIFLKGIRTYMQENADFMTHIDKDKLLKYMTAEAHRNGFLDTNLNTQTVIENWISKPGIPLITVIRDYKRGTVKVKQERFFRDRQLQGTDTTKWWVPLTYTTECGLAFNDTRVDVWLAPDAESVTMTGFRGLVDWVIFNLEAAGLYMVNYDNENWEFIIRYLKKPTFKLIPTLNRVHLIDNVASLAWSGRVPYTTFFNLMEYLKLENEFLPWRIAIRSFNELNTLLKNTRIYTGFTEFARRIIRPVYSETSRVQLKRVSVLEKIHHVVQVTTIACKYEIYDCSNTVVQHLENLREHIFHKSDVTWSNDLHEVFYCNSIKNGSKALWQTMLVQYQKTKRPAMKRIALIALGCTTNHTVLSQYLELAMNETVIRKSDIPIVFTAVLNMRYGLVTVKTFLHRHMKILYENISPRIQDLSTIMLAVAKYTSTTHEYKWLEEFFARHFEYFKDIKDGVDRALEIAKLSLQWHQENYMTFEKYIKKYVILPSGLENVAIDID